MLNVPLDRLSQDEVERHAQLRSYFCDKDAKSEIDNMEWRLHLHWPDDQQRHVDPKLEAGLNWWGEDVSLANMALAYKREEKILTALYDTWTLHSWSEWLTNTPPERINDVVILHIDDHRDISAPRLFIQGNHWIDAITEKPVDLFNPSTIRHAIESGAIGMGSFMTPFLHAVPTAEVRHLCQPPKTTESIVFNICLTSEPDTLLDPKKLKPSIELLKTQESLSKGRYLQTSDMNEWLHGIGDRPILLHIDMDYFNNRYDGDSDWATRKDALDPHYEEIEQRISLLISAFSNNHIGKSIEDVVIAFSPGFFPAEFWPSTNEKLRNGLRKLL